MLQRNKELQPDKKNKKRGKMSENEESKDKSKENKSIKENTKSLSLKRNKPVRPQRLRIKRGAPMK